MEGELTSSSNLKIIKILEYFLSLHEADEVYNMIFDESVSEEEIIKKIKDFFGGNI